MELLEIIRLNYTQIHSAYLQEIRDCSNPFIFQQNPSWRTTLFSIKKLGITPYKYQHLLWKHYHTDKRVITTKSRQIGVSTAKQIFSLDCVENNLYPSGIHNNTKIGIVSRDAKASTKMLREILELGRKQDAFNENNEFKEMIDFNAPNNMTQITLKNKCWIKCFAPTESIRGETFDISLPDEGAFIDDEIFYNCIVPTVSKTNGKILPSSTPNGQKGWFFETFDPFDKFKVHEYTRFWFFWKQCEDPQMLKIIRQQREIAKMKGNLKNFDQEYCYHKDTEYLTERGWKKYVDITEKDLLGCYNKETKKLEYNHYFSRIWYKSEKLIGFGDYAGKIKRDVISVTPNHNIFYKHKNQFKFKQAISCPNEIQVIDKLEWEGQDKEYFTIYHKQNKCLKCNHKWFFTNRKIKYIKPYCPKCRTSKIKQINHKQNFKMYDFLAFIGYFITEGHIRGNRIVISQKFCEKSLKMDTTMRFIMRKQHKKIIRNGFHFWDFSNKLIAVWINKNIGYNSFNKKIPQEFLFLPKYKLQILFDSLILGDGWIDKRTGHKYYGTMSNELANGIMELGLKLGYSVYQRRNKKMYILSFSDYKYRTLKKRTILDYNDYVGCFTVPTGILITKLNGRISIQGNCALYTVDESAFFDNLDVEKAINHSLAMEYTWNLTPCSVGLDYGQTKSATAISVKTMFKGKLRTLFQWAAVDFDENLLMDESFDHSMPNLRKRYSVQWLVVDDCSQGYRTNLELENKGYPVKRYDWGRGSSKGSIESKHRYYYGYRAALKKGIVEYPEIREMIVEMKQLMEVRMKLTTSIEKPKSGMDDRIDSEVMASIPFLEEEGSFESILIEAKPLTIKEQFTVHRTDTQWDELKASSIDVAALVIEHNRKILEKNVRE